jgi:hypothetical protein
MEFWNNGILEYWEGIPGNKVTHLWLHSKRIFRHSKFEMMD